MKKQVVLALLTLALAPSLADAADDTGWTWAGLEILGNHNVPRADIEPLISLPLGDLYHGGDAPFWTEDCDQVRQRFQFASVDCGERPLLVFGGRKAYLIVDIVEKGREGALKFRDAPTGSVPFVNEEMITISRELDAKTMAAGMAGRGYPENGKRGYLSYENPTGENEDLAPLVQRLAELVPQYRDNVLEVLRGEKEAKNRMRAATLLNWAGNPERTLRETIPLLDDPDPGVRNNLSRYMIHFVGTVDSKRLRHRLIESFVQQIEQPSHGDRNKGLYNLLEIANARPDDREFIRSRGAESIRYLAENSIVFNVQGPAQELIGLIQPGAPPEERE